MHEAKLGDGQALPLSRRGSRKQSLGKRRGLFGQIRSGGVWRRQENGAVETRLDHILS
jgi:hypothetical protein